MQQKVFESDLISPSKGRKRRKEEESLKPGTLERRLLLFRTVVGKSLSNESEKFCSYRCSTRGSCTSLIKPGCVDWPNVKDNPQNQQALQ